MDFREFKLNALLEVSKAINANMAPKKLFLLLKFFLKNQLKIERLLLVTCGDEEHNVTISEGIPHEVETHFLAHHAPIKKVLQKENLREKGLPLFQVGFPVLHNGEIKACLLLGWEKTGGSFTVNPILKNLRFIQTLANLVVVAVENKKLVAQKIENERIKKELELAAHIQRFLIPRNLPKEKGFSASAYYKPFQEVGGDYYDWIPLGNNKHFFCIADIAGKGVQAAMIMANFQARIKAQVLHHRSLAAFIQHLNENVFELTEGDSFITFFGGIYDVRHQTLEYINAGHFAPFLASAKGLDKLNSFYPGLGMVEDVQLSETKTITLSEESSLVCYTDGVMDIQMNDGNYLGEEGLEEMLRNTSFESPRTAIGNLLSAIKEKITAGGTYSDDLTLFALQLGHQ